MGRFRSLASEPEGDIGWKAQMRTPPASAKGGERMLDHQDVSTMAKVKYPYLYPWLGRRNVCVG